MTPTIVCKIMNKIYDMLKKMSIKQLEECRDTAAVKLRVVNYNLFIYQVNETIRRKREGIWK